MLKLLNSLWYANKQEGGHNTRSIKLTLLFLLLLPASYLFRLLLWLRLALYRLNILTTGKIIKPIIVVGNLSVGGTGKTPLCIYLAETLKSRGWQPAVISRGYKSQLTTVKEVNSISSAGEVGDEPLLIKQRLEQMSIPVWVGSDRLAVINKLLINYPQIDVIISDDGLQHYRMPRTCELVVCDQRGFGNAHCLPAGPLREPLSRLASIDALIINGNIDIPRQIGGFKQPAFRMSLNLLDNDQIFYSLQQPEIKCAIKDLSDKKLLAIAGIGHPERFYTTLRGLGLQFSCKSFADHHHYTDDDFTFTDDFTLLMTEKDAVKCRIFTHINAWVLPVYAQLEALNVTNCSALQENLNLIDLVEQKLNNANYRLID